MTALTVLHEQHELLVAFYALGYTNEQVARIWRRYAGITDNAAYIAALRGELTRAQQETRKS